MSNGADADDDDELYGVEKLLDMRSTGSEREFLVRWLGYTSEDDSWEPESNLGGCTDLIKEYFDHAIHSIGDEPAENCDDAGVVATTNAAVERTPSISPICEPVKTSLVETAVTESSSAVETKSVSDNADAGSSTKPPSVKLKSGRRKLKNSNREATPSESKLRDPFWQNLEEGNVDFSENLYERVKRHRGSTSGLDGTDAIGSGPNTRRRRCRYVESSTSSSDEDANVPKKQAVEDKLRSVAPLEKRRNENLPDTVQTENGVPTPASDSMNQSPSPIDANRKSAAESETNITDENMLPIRVSNADSSRAVQSRAVPTVGHNNELQTAAEPPMNSTEKKKVLEVMPSNVINDSTTTVSGQREFDGFFPSDLTDSDDDDERFPVNRATPLSDYIRSECELRSSCIDLDQTTTNLMTACIDGAAEKVHRIFQRLISDGQAPDVECVDSNGKTLLMSVVLMQCSPSHEHDDVIELLIRNGAKVNATDVHGYTALSHAIIKGHVCKARKLLSAGAAVNKPSDSGETALMLACKLPSVSLACCLLESGADFNVGMPTGETAATVCTSNPNLSNILQKHVDGVQEAYVNQLQHILSPELFVIVKTVFPVRCWALRDGDKFRIKFKQEHEPTPPTNDLIYVLAAGLTRFRSGLKTEVNFQSKSPLTDVWLNDVRQQPVTASGKHLFTFWPLRKGLNDLVLHADSHRQRTSDCLLLEAYLVHAMSNHVALAC